MNRLFLGFFLLLRLGLFGTCERDVHMVYLLFQFTSQFEEYAVNGKQVNKKKI
jgi:hypothetical protein